MSDFQVNEPEPESSAISAMAYEDYPSLYQNANQAAIQMQRYHFCFHRLYLYLLIIGSGFAPFAATIPEALSTWFHAGVVVILTIGVLINIGARAFKHDEKWFGCRSIAESTKNAAWRFMMKATPFDDDNSINETFASTIRKIRNDSQSSLDSLAQYKTEEAKLISDHMTNVREKSIAERQKYYLQFRLSDQKAWYSTKASYNSKSKSRWLTMTMALQGSAIVFSIIQLISNWGVNFVPILMTCAAASIAWSRMKRHSELAQSYVMVAHELEETRGDVVKCYTRI